VKKMRLEDLPPEIWCWMIYSGILKPKEAITIACASNAIKSMLFDDPYTCDWIRSYDEPKQLVRKGHFRALRFAAKSQRLDKTDTDMFCNAICSIDAPTLEFLLEYGFDPNSMYNHTVSCITLALLRDEIVFTELLERFGGDIHQTNNDNETVIHQLVFLNMGNIRRAIHRAMERGVHVDRRDDRARTPLIMAIQENCARTAYELVLWGADPNIVWRQTTPLQFALSKTTLDTASAIISASLQRSFLPQAETLEKLQEQAQNAREILANTSL